MINRIIQMYHNTIVCYAKRSIALILAIAMVAAFGCGKKEEVAVTDDPNQTSAPVASPASNDNQGTDTQEIIKTEQELKFEEAKTINEDVVGWIQIENTRIDYPIVLHEDNDFYIDHNLEKKDSKSGAIFMDFRNVDPVQQRHIILYGHNMKDGSMFHDLANYKNRDFFENNQRFKILMFGEEREYEIIGQYILNIGINFVKTYFENDQQFIDFMKELQKDSKFRTDYKPDPSDEILTLSTCSYEYDDMRCVVQAKRIS